MADGTDRDEPVESLRELQFILIRVRDSNRYEHLAMQKAIRDLEDAHTQSVRERVETMNAVQKLNARLDRWEAADQKKEEIEAAPRKFLERSVETAKLWVTVALLVVLAGSYTWSLLHPPPSAPPVDAKAIAKETAKALKEVLAP